MKHTHSALLLVCLASFLLTGCGSGKAGSSENPYVCTKQTANAGNYVTYDYDTSGNCTKESRYSASGNLTGWTETTYNEDNQPTEILTYGETGDIQTRVQNKYKNGNVISTVSLDGSNGKDYEETFSYDKNGHLTKRVHTEHHGSASNNYWCEITMDDQGRQTKSVQRSGTEDHPAADTITVESLYNEAGHLVKSSTYTNDALDSWDEMDYDADGQLVNTSTYDAQGNLQVKYTNTYDKHGNLTQTDILTADKNEPLVTYDYLTLKQYLKNAA